MGIEGTQLVTQASLMATAPVVDALGVVARAPDPSLVGKSGVPIILGPERTAVVEVRRARGARLLHFNYAAAHAARLAVPDGHAMTPAFAEAFLDRFALRTDADPAAEATTLTATAYAQSEGNAGDGRGGITERGNLFVKGVGATEYVTGRANMSHSHGYLALKPAVVEICWAAVCSHLFDVGGPSIPALIGLDKFIDYSGHDAYLQPAVILVRSGTGIRYAHFIEQTVYNEGIRRLIAMVSAIQVSGSDDSADRVKTAGGYVAAENQAPLEGGTIDPETFFRAAFAYDLLLFRPSPEGDGFVPDIQATIRHMMDLLAHTSAQQFRWRILHAAPSAGNTQVDGSLLDFEDSSTNPRTARFYALNHTPPFGWNEYRNRYMILWMLYESLRLNLSADQREIYNLAEIDFEAEFRAAYLEHLTVEFLRAAGLKREVAVRLAKGNPVLARAFRDVLNELATLENDGPIPRVNDFDGTRIRDESPIRDKSVVDVFGMLGALPTDYFRDPDSSLVEPVLRHLRPHYAGDAEAQEAQVRALAERLAPLYVHVMTEAENLGWDVYDDGLMSFAASVRNRAQFENQPIDELYLWRFQDELDVLHVRHYDGADSSAFAPETITAMIDRKIALSMRNVDVLLRQGRTIPQLSDDRVETGVMTRDHIDFGISADTISGDRSLFVRIPLSSDDGENFTLPWSNGGVLSLDELSQAEITFTLFGPETDTQTVTAHFEQGDDGIYLVFDTQVDPSNAGVFQGRMTVRGATYDLPLHAFAVPDNKDLAKLLAESGFGSVSVVVSNTAEDPQPALDEESQTGT